MYKFQTKPKKHQLAEFEEHAHDLVRGLFWEMGVGKTKPVIDSTASLYLDGKVDALLVIAPNGVHRNWVSDEIPLHMPTAVLAKTRCHVWYSTTTKRHAREFEATLAHDGLAVLVMSYNAVWTDRGKVAWKKFLQQRKCMYVLDESQRIKNPNAKWAKRILGSIGAAEYRRVLTGTPVDNSPFDVYNQLRFLDPKVLHQYGIKNFGAFKQYFGIWETWNTENGSFPKCIAFRNLETLYKELHRLGHRLTKDDAGLDLPPKTYSKQYVDLTTNQRRIYKTLKEEMEIEMACGHVLSAPLAIVRLLRFQQIICGYLPKSDDDDEIIDIPGGNPRLSLLAEICADLPHKAIIWARFRRDIDLICEHPTFRGRCVRVDGKVTGEARGKALDEFQKGDTQFLIGNPAAIGTGVTLHAARTVIYYSNSFKLSDRLQSEDRAHRIGQEHPVHYIDLIAHGTVDTRIVESLRLKVSIASLITGDVLKEWI